MNKQDRRIRVLEIVPKLISAGGQRVVLDLAQNLDSRKFQVEIVSLYPFSEEPFELCAREAGIQVHYLNKKAGFDPHVLFDMKNVFNTRKPDVVHNHLYGLYTILPSSLIYKTPVLVHTVHTLAEQEAPMIHRMIQKFAFQRLNVLPVSISRTVQQAFWELYGNIDSPLIYNGVDVRKFVLRPSARLEWRKKIKLPDKKFVFVNIASFTSPKNHHLLLEAFSIVLQNCPDSVLLLIGDGPLRQEMESYAAMLGIFETVVFAGLRSDIPDVLNASDCFVLSSDWEGLPISILEAMAAYKPVIATDVGGVSEVVSHSENGLLVQAGDVRKLSSALISLYQDVDRAKIMGQRGRETVEKRFDVREMASQYDEWYINQLEKTIGHTNY